jgi:hypothetical protein
VIEALDDRPRAGRDPVITAAAKTWLVALACRKAKELGYPTSCGPPGCSLRMPGNTDRPTGHPSLAKLAQGTLCKILAEQEVKPHKVRYYLQQRDPEFEPKMAEILCVYRQSAMLRRDAAVGQDSGGGGSLAIVSYDEKPGIQPIGTTAADRPPLPGTSPTVLRDHEYKHHGTLTLMAGIDLLTGHVHALVKERHRSRGPSGALPSRSRRRTGHGSISSRASSPSWRVRCCATSASAPNTKHELKERLIAFIGDINREPVVHTWRYKIDNAA